jgi:hypothetical protein
MATIQRVPRTAQPAPTAAPPTAYYVPVGPPRRGSGLGLVAGVLLAMIFLIVAIGAALFMIVASLTGFGGRTVGEAGRQVNSTLRSAGEALGQAGQEARDRLDPSHPPRTALAYDAEIEDFLKLSVGQALPGGNARAFTLAAIKSREEGAERPELARYAVIHSELRQPNETKLFGLTVRKDSEPRDDYLYQGEAFRLGGQVYKVNWISPERQQVALIQLRDPDRVGLPLKFVYE